MRTSSSSSSYPRVLGENVCGENSAPVTTATLYCSGDGERGNRTGMRERSGQGPSRQSGGAANYRHDPLVLWHYSVSPPK